MDLTDDSNMDSSSPASDETVCASGSSRVLRKRRPRPTVESEDDGFIVPARDATETNVRLCVPFDLYL
jgi:hypothetical protein